MQAIIKMLVKASFKVSFFTINLPHFASGLEPDQ